MKTLVLTLSFLFCFNSFSNDGIPVPNHNLKCKHLFSNLSKTGPGWKAMELSLEDIISYLYVNREDPNKPFIFDKKDMEEAIAHANNKELSRNESLTFVQEVLRMPHEKRQEIFHPNSKKD